MPPTHLSSPNPPSTKLPADELRRIRWVIGFFIVGLVISGLTAFPLVWELELLCRLAGIPDQVDLATLTGLPHWLALVRQGLQESAQRYPFLAYGTDWLAFGHLIIACFFVGPWQDPVRNRFILRVGMFACVAVVPLALICGPIRGIPFYWRLIDCSFGIFGILPLWWVWRRLPKE